MSTRTDEYKKGYNDGVADMESVQERADKVVLSLVRVFIDERATSYEERIEIVKEAAAYLANYCTVEHEYDEQYFNGAYPQEAVHVLDTEEFMKGNAYTLMDGELFVDWMQRHNIKPDNEEDYLNYSRIYTRLLNAFAVEDLPEAEPVEEVEPSVIKVFDVEYHEVVEEAEEVKDDWGDMDIPF